MAEFRNPNLQGQGGTGGGGGEMGGMMTFILVALFAVLAFQIFLKPKQAQTPPPQTAQQASAPAQPHPAVIHAQPAAPTPMIVASAMTETTVENHDLKVVFTNQGAQAEHWILLGKQYKDHPGPDSKQLDLVNSRTSAFGLPLSLFTYEPELTRELNSALYQVSVSGAVSPAGAVEAPCTITFHYAAHGLDVVKTFRFDASYVVKADVEVKRDGVPVRALLAWPAGLGDQIDPMQFAYGKFDWSLHGKDKSMDAKKVSNDDTLNEPYDYAAISDLYFAAAFLPDSLSDTTVVTLHHSIELAENPEDSKSPTKAADVIGLAVGSTSGSTRLRLYAGPKQTGVLDSIHATGPDGRPTGPTLEPLIQFGMWTIIAKPLYLALRGLHKLLGTGAGNWGWAIIIFTVVFNVLMLPTRLMAMRSSLKMMRIQPKIDAIKRRYSNLKPTDPKRGEMNTEMMALYKTEGVNMYGGCLPMLPQIPLFFAYYKVLLNAVELRQAPWLWLKDLSAPDPTYVLPIVIIITMFLTQYITPSPGMDANQRRMMAVIMPLFFGFMLLHYASGLALYWGTSNVINLIMQLGINQSSMGKEMHEISARRAAKKIGARPKTIAGKH
ncbi:MAG: membrane protein insertase YidC [Terracidiphilus sp.]